MRTLIIVIITLAALATAQTDSSKKARSQSTPPAAGSVAAPAAAANPAGRPKVTFAPAKAPETKPDPPIATLKGLCKTRTPQNGCQTVITRSELDRFTRAFAPETDESVRGRMAIQYAKSLTYATLAELQGLDKNPALAKELEEQLKMVRMRILATAYLQNIQAHTNSLTGVEVDQYYEAHRNEYVEAQVRRVSVPFVVATDTAHPPDRAAIRAEMEILQRRAAAGEDLNQLQQQAFKDLHIPVAPVPVIATTLRRNLTQGDETKVWGLNNGEVTPVLDLPASYAFMKLDTKVSLRQESVRQEIETEVRLQQLLKALSNLSKTITPDFDLKYLNLPAQPDLFGTSTTPSVTRTVARRRAGAMRRSPNLAGPHN